MEPYAGEVSTSFQQTGLDGQPENFVTIPATADGTAAKTTTTDTSITWDVQTLAEVEDFTTTFPDSPTRTEYSVEFCVRLGLHKISPPPPAELGFGMVNIR